MRAAVPALNISAPAAAREDADTVARELVTQGETSLAEFSVTVELELDE